MESNVQPTSIEAFESIQPQLGLRQMEVFNCIKEIQPCSNLDISKKLGLAINSVVPRCLELRKENLVVLDRVDKDIFTGRRVMYWRTVG